ncbi:MAG: tRNA uridine-5-carboxymethylaminomethyl(34) synthesis enzyme MnmG [Bacteroidetes bacterium RIFOXYA12_FULL_35_11]|nr:MAG: tRNA uridine-5-carboxymethylaminomethyl(34) synthesis enzyme MnmG [Bacteroidetes bacterium GWF2_35_48]OFY75251.1 MAG: tRNA uridine-5-carboxymethylaminomethyl(34) synthesis enzyme MnmG [Bacteroidetes bacterium RIFOXYA12_FULL_35_11]OFY96926.1 MAG: tRNA uridine-5-carboxymethylaminomethyl(34) synthesis enzyme MnmG [Bacteroidetes bacterium RIFOXYB2_FULL_35_7]HBX51001.1 tRNA uridine-5-carboxymethylaminomethyl(34) synthesis enzyme MnmG [Bacteroidales bacterium]
MDLLPLYDVIVVGGGHAGCEAAAAAAKLGSKTLLITMDMTKFAQMSCNPAMGGVAKGQIVREIDALGGYAGIVTDRSMIQFRMLNRSKGPAMWSPRAQCDKNKFTQEWRAVLETIPNINFWQDSVVSLIFENNELRGVKTQFGISIYGRSVILTAGTFLNGLMHIGKNQINGGRYSEPSSHGITEQLAEMGFVTGRMKTGTPVRIDGRTLDFSKMSEQKGDERIVNFSSLHNNDVFLKQSSCYIINTDESVHESLRQGLKESPMYDGTIQSIGPRYCPSIETKLVIFPGKDHHQLFLEPEMEDGIEYYLNGFSSSLPWEVQLKSLRLIPGFEKAEIFRPGYAIEYDFFDPTQLYHTLETKRIPNLYFAGQVNGTTGYEEAGAQGMMAAINAHQKLNGSGDFQLGRDESYIGVLIDDLVTKGVDEPYRMFTSRAEYRILLRQDTADIRLTGKGYKIGLASSTRNELMKTKMSFINELISYCSDKSIEPSIINSFLEKKNSSPIIQKTKLINLIKRPDISIFDISEFVPELKSSFDKIEFRSYDTIESAEIEMKYSGYIEREKQMADKYLRLENIKIPDRISYFELKSISTEGRQKLSKIKPSTIGQASRISGVSPADINVLLVYLGR